MYALYCSNSARFLWKSIPAAIKESRPEVGAAWKIGQRLWTRDYEGVHEAIREFNWSPEAHDLVVSFSGKLLRLPCSQTRIHYIGYEQKVTNFYEVEH